ncbi:MAG: DNA translocase FtsK [Tannerella sp.]|jgi:S-DNA-T family DNA segregation ATPase FtsK/SpoIIIE|nr:DNA translocase FtsK [Tannerella sp.]
MSRKKDKKNKVQHQSPPPKKVKKKRIRSPFFESVKHYTTSPRVHFIIGLIVGLFTIYIGIAVLSFFFTGKADQSIVNALTPSELILKKDGLGIVRNWAGIRGAYLAEIIINEWFGIPSMLLIFFLGSIGFRMMRLCRIHLLRRFLICSIATIWSSLLLSFVFSGAKDLLFYRVGGLNGDLLCDFLIKNIGHIGVVILLLAIFVIMMIFLNKNFVPYIQDKLSFGKVGRQVLVSCTDEDEDEPEPYDDEEEEDEDSSEAVTSAVSDSDLEPFVVQVATGTDDDKPYDHLSELGTYDPRLDLSRYVFPDIGLLKKYDQPDKQVDMEEQTENKNRIKKTLEDFGINIVSIKATVGPTITLYEVVPDKGVRISRIKNLEDDIALSLAALGIRIIAPMPGKGTIGIEVPNKNPQIVSMESVVSSRKFVESKYELPIVLGRTITNDVFMFDLTKMPHLLVAGATGQGKSVGLNAIITSLLYKKHPAELKFVLIDPKMVEFNIYEDIERHYLAKLPEMDHAIITDFSNVIDTLKSLCKEMDDRYDLLMNAHVRNITEYNSKFINRNLNPEKGHRFMPYIVVIIDEFGDLIMTAGKEIEMPIARIAQKARAVGIHMIIATQRPSANIITGVIKANFPARVGFKVSSMIDSRTILDTPGANKLVGRGDLLFSQGNELTRVQCALINTEEIEGIVKFIGDQPGFESAYQLPEVLDEGADGGTKAVDMTNLDSQFEDAARLIVTQQQGSTSLIQRRFSIGYNRAGRLMDQIEAAGIVGPIEAGKVRQVLVQDLDHLEQILNRLRS